jgi:hypothetical protein
MQTNLSRQSRETKALCDCLNQHKHLRKQTVAHDAVSALDFLEKLCLKRHFAFFKIQPQMQPSGLEIGL